MATHDLDLAAELCERTIVMSGGRTVAADASGGGRNRSRRATIRRAGRRAASSERDGHARRHRRARVESMVMTLDLLTAGVIALYGVSAALLVFAVARQSLDQRRQRRLAVRLAALRGPFEAAVLDGVELPPLAGLDHGALLQLALRYVRVLRGTEAARVRDMVEQNGIVDQLLKDLAAGDQWRRAQAADLLGRLRIRRSVADLIAALDDRSEDVRTVAARSLAAIGAPAAIPALAATLADPSRWTLSLVAENLMAMGPAALPELIALLECDQHNVRVAAAQILGEIRDPAAAPPLLALLRNASDLNLRAQTVAALGRLGGLEVLEALVVALEDPEWQVRAQAAKALGRIGHPDAAEPLAAALPDLHWWVRVNCAEALARLGAAGRSRLDVLTKHPDAYVRDQARAALALYGLQEGAL